LFTRINKFFVAADADPNYLSREWFRGIEHNFRDLFNVNRDYLEDIVDFKRNHRDKAIAFRQERGLDKIQAYTNDVEIVKDAFRIKNTYDNAKLTVEEVANTFPEGVKYFKEDPPAKMRVHFNDYYGPTEIKQELTELFSRLDATPSRSLKETLNYQWKGVSNCWLGKTLFFDCNDESTISYFSLMFPHLVGKIYRLEKKPENL
jgi:hypothetical protein